MYFLLGETSGNRAEGAVSIDTNIFNFLYYTLQVEHFEFFILHIVRKPCPDERGSASINTKQLQVPLT